MKHNASIKLIGATFLVVVAFLAACGDDNAPCPQGSIARNGTCFRPEDAGTSDGAITQDADGAHARDAAMQGTPDAGPRDGRAEAQVDAETSPDAATAPCYVDMDGDGVGAGEPVPCNMVHVTGDAGPHQRDGAASIALADKAGDCDDLDPERAPSLKELCDSIDNDCDNDVDEDALNDCGGTCIVPFEHHPGEACGNGLLGACARAGTYSCQGTNAVACNAPMPSPSNELCGDNVDNDCDGQTNEADAVDAQSWFQDCDRDGYAASTTGGIRACTKPADAGSCAWTATIPQPGTKTNWDCDDSRARYKPGADFGVPPAGATSFDLDCNGVTEKENKIRDSNGYEGQRCPASENGAYCKYWTNEAGDNLSTQPPCSATLSVTYPADYVDCSQLFCTEVPYKGAQYCR